jgi:hypothetical protein
MTEVQQEYQFATQNSRRNETMRGFNCLKCIENVPPEMFWKRRGTAAKIDEIDPQATVFL